MEFSAKLFVLLALVGAACATSSSISLTDPTHINIKGVVNNITRCGGNGTPLQLRINFCDGYCNLVPGHVHSAEYDMIPSLAASGLSLAVDLVHLGGSLRLFEQNIPNSSVQPGLTYTLKFNFVPNDILAGQEVKLRMIIFHTSDRYLELCGETDVYIYEL